MQSPIKLVVWFAAIQPLLAAPMQSGTMNDVDAAKTRSYWPRDVNDVDAAKTRSYWPREAEAENDVDAAKTRSYWPREATKEEN